MIKKIEIEEAAEKTKKAVEILKETMALNSSVRLEDWVTAFHIIIAISFHAAEASYKDYSNHLEEARRTSKPLWD